MDRLQLRFQVILAQASDILEQVLELFRIGYYPLVVVVGLLGFQTIFDLGIHLGHLDFAEKIHLRESFKITAENYKRNF